MGGVGGLCSDLCWAGRGGGHEEPPARGGEGMASSTPAGQEALPMSGHPLAPPPPTAGSLLEALRTAGLASLTRWQRVSLSLNSPWSPCCWDSHSEP